MRRGSTIHLACGDSLLHGSPGGDQLTMGWAPTDHVYQPEDRDALERLLRPKTYHAVVANPPYITPKDRALNPAYRERYSDMPHDSIRWLCPSWNASFHSLWRAASQGRSRPTAS